MLKIMNVNEWQSRLEEAFTVNGLVGGLLVGVQRREQEIGEHLVRTWSGHTTLIDSFQSFFIETLDLAVAQISTKGWPAGGSNYAVALAHFLAIFRRYRACELLFYDGYPLDAYSLFRDIKDRAFLLAGVAHNITTFERLLGLVPPIVDPAMRRKQGTRQRKEEEHRVTNRIFGKTSGLRADVIAELKFWDDLFHDEVHGGRLSLNHKFHHILKGAPNRPGPTSHEQGFTVYMNRAAELGWLVLRLLPFLQMSQDAFGKDWQEKWSVLDSSFRIMVQGLKKKIAEAFVILVDERFDFKKPFHYFEADGSA